MGSKSLIMNLTWPPVCFLRFSFSQRLKISKMVFSRDDNLKAISFFFVSIEHQFANDYVRFHSFDWIFSIKSIFFSNFVLQSLYCNCCNCLICISNKLENTYKKRKLCIRGWAKIYSSSFHSIALVQQREHKKQP